MKMSLVVLPIFVGISFFAICNLGFAASKPSLVCETFLADEIQALKRGPTESLVRALAKYSSSPHYSQTSRESVLRYNQTYYPTKHVAATKLERYEGSFRYLNGRNIEIVADIIFKNLTSGFQTPRWQNTNSLELVVYSSTGSAGEKVILNLDGFYYLTKFAATKRFKRFRGLLQTSDGQFIEIRADLEYKNLRKDGLAAPAWKPTGNMTVRASSINK